MSKKGPELHELLAQSRAMYEHAHPAAPDVEPLYIADRRIQIGPALGKITVDFAPKKMHHQTFAFLYRFALTPDVYVTYEDLARDIYGMDGLSASGIHSFGKSFQGQVGIIRKALGPELGDLEYGAIRSANPSGSRKNPGGYMAVSEL